MQDTIEKAMNKTGMTNKVGIWRNEFERERERERERE